MIQSMTGFGTTTLSTPNYKVTVELKSLNSKFIEISLKVPKSHIGNEMTLRNHLTNQLQRGKVAALLSVEVLNAATHELPINRELVKKYVKELTALQQELGLDSKLSLEFLLTLPDAMRSDNEEADQEEWNLIEKAFHEATQLLVLSRIEEGKALMDDLVERVRMISKNLEQVEKRLPLRAEKMREKLRMALEEVKANFDVDQNRFEQELIYYIEKLDVNEEIVRLKKHIEYFNTSLNEKDSNGKRMGFISQEMGREINTIGSKANDADIQIFVVQMKEELERIKEQVLNII